MKPQKKWWIVLVAVVVAAAGIYAFVLRPRKAMQQMNQSVSFIRTTTLRKTSLEETISATGLVASNNVSYVTTTLNAAVKTIEVAVGDFVEEGDIVVTLDTEEINKQITRAEERLQDSIEVAQEAYDSAVTGWQKAKESYEDVESEYDAASAEYRAIREEYNTALELVEDLIDQVDEANRDLKDAQLDLAALLKDQNRLEADLAKARLDTENPDQQAILDKLNDALAELQDEIDAAEITLATAQQQARTAADELAEMEALTGYNTLYKNYTTAKTAYSSAGARLEAAEETKDDARERMLDAKEALEEAKTGTSDELEDLYDHLEDYTLRAETSGYVTALNATVGSRPSDLNVAVIQDTDDLVIAISIAEYDIDSVELGMKAVITSDSIDGEVTGTLTQIDPVATGGMSESATFLAEVSVDGRDSGLIIGVNAKVELIVSSTDDVFVVPIDAVETKPNGDKIVYVKTGGSGVDATFEEVSVETGAETDYYIEIMGDDLCEGMEVRASANLTEATFTQQEGAAGEEGFAMGGMMMPGGMPSGGGMPGGGRPSGMPGGF